MRITFFGSGAGTATPGRAGTSILVQSRNHALLLDCGPRAIDRLIDSRIAPDSIGSIVITHLHPDHALGLPAFIQAAMFPENKVPGIFGPPGTSAFVKDTSLMLSHISSPANAPWGVPQDLAVSEVVGGEAWELPGFIVRAEVVHHVPYLVALAYRVTSSEGRIVFSGDTTPLPDVMTPLAEGADVLIHECWSTGGLDRWLVGADPRRAAAIRKAFRETHSEVNAVARIAADAGVKRLVLTHLNEGELAHELVAEAARAFRGEIVIAEDRLSLEV